MAQRGTSRLFAINTHHRYRGAVSLADLVRADLAASQDSLSKTTVKAPLAGIVTALPIKEGEVTVIGTMNMQGTQLMTISDMSTVEAVLMVDETDVPNVKVGQKAVLAIEAYPDRAFEGLVTQVENSPIAKNDSDLQGLITTSDAINFKVRVKILQPPETTRPGFSVTADVIIITKVDTADSSKVQELKRTISSVNPTATVIESTMPITVDGTGLDTLAGGVLGLVIARAIRVRA